MLFPHGASPVLIAQGRWSSPRPAGASSACSRNSSRSSPASGNSAVLVRAQGQKTRAWQCTASPPADDRCLIFFSFMLIATPKWTSALEKPLVSRTSNTCFRLISNYSFREFRPSCPTATYSPGTSSAASGPTVQKGPRRSLANLIFSAFKTNFMKIYIVYFRDKLSKEFPSQSGNSSAVCA